MKITRRSKVGFGYNMFTTSDADGWHIDPPEQPQHTGTVRQVMEAIRGDQTLKASRGTFKSTAWFVRHGGQWKRCKLEQYAQPPDLLDKDIFSGGDGKYFVDYITVEIGEDHE